MEFANHASSSSQSKDSQTGKLVSSTMDSIPRDKNTLVQGTSLLCVVPPRRTVMIPAASRAVLLLGKRLLALNADLGCAWICSGWIRSGVRHFLPRIHGVVQHLHALDHHIRFRETLLRAIGACVILLDTALCVRRLATTVPFEAMREFLLV